MKSKLYINRLRNFRKQIIIGTLLVTITIQLAYGYWSVTSGATHLRLTREVIGALDRTEYPDIWKFAGSLNPMDRPQELIVGGSDNEDAHYEPDASSPSGRGQRQYWFRNEYLWEDNILNNEYPSFKFQRAYTQIGYIVHLDEDSTVPPHAKVVFHGPGPDLFPIGAPYFYEPGADIALPNEHPFYRSDDFEWYAYSHPDVGTGSTDWDRRYHHTADNCDWKYWLSSLEERRGQRDPLDWEKNWGGYGRGCIPGCIDPWHDGRDESGRSCASNGGDWYGRSNPDHPEIAQGQLFLARQKAKEDLERLSKLLPPLFRNFKLSRNQFSRAQGTSISFEALENRKAQVRISLQVVELDDQSQPIPGTERPILTPEYGTWFQLPVNLDPTAAADLTKLPWEKSFTITWDGSVPDEYELLQEGVVYALWLKIYDADDNESPDIPDPDRRGLWRSLQKFAIVQPRLASASRDKTVGIWEPEQDFAFIRSITDHSSIVYSVNWAPDGKRLASASADQTVRVWDAEDSYRHLATLNGHTNFVRTVVWSPNGLQLASGSDDKTVLLWDAVFYQARATLSGHTSSVNSVAWSPSGRWLASGSDDRTVIIWEAESALRLSTLTGHTNWVTSVAWAPDGRSIASGSQDRTIRIWDGVTFALKTVLTGPASPVKSVAWAPDGRRIIGGFEDGTIRMWDIATCPPANCQPIRTLTQGPAVWSVAWSPDARWIASGSALGTILIWDAQSFSRSATLSQHRDRVYSLAWTGINVN